MLCSLRLHLSLSMHPALYLKEINTVTETCSTMEKLVCIFKTRSSNTSVVVRRHITSVLAPHFVHTWSQCEIQFTLFFTWFFLFCKVREASREEVREVSFCTIRPHRLLRQHLLKHEPQGDKRVQLFCAVCEAFAMNTQWMASWNPSQVFRPLKPSKSEHSV